MHKTYMGNNTQRRFGLVLLGGAIFVCGRVRLFFSLLTTATSEKSEPEHYAPPQINIDKEPADIPFSLSPEQTSDAGKSGGSINILLPPHITDSMLAALHKEMYDTSELEVHVHSTQTWQEYITSVQQDLETPYYDLILAPSTWRESFAQRGTSAGFDTPIHPVFHTAFKDYIISGSPSIIPFSLDPYITLVSTTLSLPKHFGFGHIQNQLITTPHLGYSINLTHIKEPPYAAYHDIFLRFMEDAYTQGSTYTLQYLSRYTPPHSTCLDRAANSCGKANAIPASPFPLSFGSLSMLNYNDALGYTIAHLPVARDAYPFKAWGRIINKNTNNTQGIATWLQGYMQFSPTYALQIRPHTFSAFQSVYLEQSTQSRYAALLSYIRSSQIRTGSLDDVDKLLATTALEEVLAGTYDRNIFVQQIFSE